MNNKVRLSIKITLLLALEIIVFFGAVVLAKHSGVVHVSPMFFLSLGLGISVAYNILFDTFVQETQKKLSVRLHAVEVNNSKLRRDFERLRTEVLLNGFKDDTHE